MKNIYKIAFLVLVGINTSCSNAPVRKMDGGADPWSLGRVEKKMKDEMMKEREERREREKAAREANENK